MFVTQQLKLMGTVIDIQIESDKACQQLSRVIDSLYTYKNRFSANDSNSELMAINQAAGVKPVSVHSDLFNLIQIGKAHSLSTPSNLNIAIGPLVQAWRIGFEDARVPSHNLISQQLALTDPRQILIDDKKQTVFLQQVGMALDLGALAKGYITDKIMAYLIEDGIDSALINLGGNVRVHGPNPKSPDKTFRIGIQKPDVKRGQHLGVIKVNNHSVVTSGIYERQFTAKGKQYHHILDRQTGYPIETDMLSLTVMAPSSLDCEIWTTRLFGLDKATVISCLNSLKHIEGLVVTKDQKIWMSKGLRPYFQALY
ncbi:apbE family protein [Streptococcus pyogenes]|uniref:FAD:protein FMN transferase n=1 Tax=Streptococcus pyogenes TaxID=1314 RepID=UPI0010A141A6|nr:FAD:protein FMN transferase [Streptococcus pyogenes]QCK25289.1 FAD:protein FMN transferase [Streptococcus pyogenes]VGY22302.1 apbE family protein [Streptococcus pyogenes]VGY58494.1 apbE family protein [Streptococcus pyogenes]VGZ21395.1 apbE family protein [Streptococcus pyogenes]VHA06016.1 apbE family protein [Streptococcus pyogenes]